MKHNIFSGSHFFSWFLLIVLALIWGSSFILMKKGLVAFTPLEIASIRIISASVFLVPTAIRNFRKVKLKQWKFLFISGFLGSLIPAFLFPLAQTRIDSGITGVLNALTPLFTVMIGALFFKDKFTLRVMVGIMIGLVGSIVLITANAGTASLTINVYAFLIILATIFYGLNVNILKYVLSDMKPLHITSLSMFMVGPFAVIYLAASGSFGRMAHLDDSAILPLFYIIALGVFGTAMALILFNKLVKVTNTVFSSSVTYLIPIVAVIWGIVDGEILLFGHFVGMFGIIFGVLIANRIKK